MDSSFRVRLAAVAQQQLNTTQNCVSLFYLCYRFSMFRIYYFVIILIDSYRRLCLFFYTQNCIRRIPIYQQLINVSITQSILGLFLVVACLLHFAFLSIYVEVCLENSLMYSMLPLWLFCDDDLRCLIILFFF